jgi:hypothetical protein
MYNLDTQPVRLTDAGWGQCNRTTEHYTVTMLHGVPAIARLLTLGLLRLVPIQE